MKLTAHSLLTASQVSKQLDNGSSMFAIFLSKLLACCGLFVSRFGVYNVIKLNPFVFISCFTSAMVIFQMVRREVVTGKEEPGRRGRAKTAPRYFFLFFLWDG